MMYSCVLSYFCTVRVPMSLCVQDKFPLRHNNVKVETDVEMIQLKLMTIF